MLVDEPRVEIESMSFPLMLVASVNNAMAGARRIGEGMYEVGHFGSSHFLRDGYDDDFWEDGRELPEGLEGYGVCDYPEQLVEKFPDLASSERRFVVTFTRVSKDRQESSGGWRWHKWGEYIGDKKPTCEYLYDEPEIDEVFTFHIYEQISETTRGK